MGVPGIPHPFKYFEKYPISLKINGLYPQNSPHFRKLRITIFLKVLCFLHKSIPYLFKYLVNIPISLKPFQGLKNDRTLKSACLLVVVETMCFTSDRILHFRSSSS